MNSEFVKNLLKISIIEIRTCQFVRDTKRKILNNFFHYLFALFIFLEIAKETCRSVQLTHNL